jgi:S-methylmethionine-dependent homocysteine/selenocysteine methylase
MELALQTVSKFPQVVAFGINCCKPADISPFLRHVLDIKSRGTDAMKAMKIVVYPNSGQEWIRGVG